MVNPSLLQARFRGKPYCFFTIRFGKGQERHQYENQILPFLVPDPVIVIAI